MDSLQLYDTVWKKVRIGRPYDGGYVIAELPGEYDGFISGGIASDISFEKAWLDKFQYDRCIAFDGTIPCLPEYDSRITFVKKNIGCEENDTHTNLHLWMEPHSNLFMKIDIEGHEFRVFPTFTETQWNKIKQLVIEIHTPGDIQLHPSYFNRLSDVTHDVMFNMLKTINRTHTLIHVHPNNGCKTHVVDGITLPNVFECTYIRNDYVEERVHNTQPLPFSIDMPNLPDIPVVPFIGYPFVSTNRKQNQYRIAIIGPGIMPIPPPGWGAVEILIAEYVQLLQTKHQFVELINILRSDSSDSNENTPYTRKLIDTINSKDYDFVHIHYDILYHIIPHLRCKHIAITSHYPYIDQFERHVQDGYDIIFKNICSSRANIFALSNKDKNAFLKGGVQSNRVFLTINGANHEEFVPRMDGTKLERSICLAKIESRKRQSLLASIPTMDFYGRCDDIFFQSHPFYRGECTHQEKIEALPQYGNMVLLSNGENGTPLVIKEALMAGLPIVVSEYATDDIDTSLPFIDVISEHHIHDHTYIEQVISNNRKKKALYTNAIRAYAMQHFSWDKLITQYIDIIHTIIQSSMSFVLVGPGMMPIPPNGWGACEILIWDYACELRKLGYHVDIVNTKDRHEMIRFIRQAAPDVVHIQYEDYADIVPHISSSCKTVLITSHFAYLEQQNRWGEYQNIFSSIISYQTHNLYHFVLSQGISQVYEQHGIHPSYIRVIPNGARSDQFRYTDTPLYPNRSIIVGKIEIRKGQYRLQHNTDVWFAGNPHDTSFDYSNPRWLGEWSKETLYHNLTDYGNLVLLSDGEADPLVVKEALTAGLGVVVSHWAAANLDTSLPFVTVIPVDRLNDQLYIDECIQKNRDISNRMRSTIREYSKQFSWSIRVRHYIDTINQVI
jgi:glycosyltransferase involved in cell wall biosynthesis